MYYAYYFKNKTETCLFIKKILELYPCECFPYMHLQT